MPPQVIDTYRKDRIHVAGIGFGRQLEDGSWTGDRLGPVRSWLIHTTSNPNKGTKFWNEATFLRDSHDVSCHDLIGKDGTLAEILPHTKIAWHAGTALASFDNRRSGGTELHCSKGETPTQAQIDTLTWRMKQIIATWSLKSADIETHRAVALPKGRKQDPEGWSDADFYKWRDSLFVSTEPDWASRWQRDDYERVKDFGISVAWRDAWRNGNELGGAVSDEVGIEGGVVRVFAKGWVSWSAAAGVKVGVWSA